VISVLAVSGVVLGAWYMLSLIKRVFFGPLREHKHAGPIPDMKLREVAALVPLCVVIVWIGVQPKFFLDRMAPSLDRLTQPAMDAVDQPAGSPGRVATTDGSRGFQPTVDVAVPNGRRVATPDMHAQSSLRDENNALATVDRVLKPTATIAPSLRDEYLFFALSVAEIARVP
jgi:hypothetical protein